MSDVRYPMAIKNIIFDFGGVICNLDVKRTEKKIMELGIIRPEQRRSSAERDALFASIEDGSLSSQDFRDALKQYFEKPVTDTEIDEAWNALLLDIPEPRIRLLEKLRKHYRIFLLSNSNEIHYRKYLRDFREQYGYDDFDGLFEKAYFSFMIGLKKPDPAVFEYVLQDSGLVAGETLFIDDTLQHAQGAEKAGMYAYRLRLDQREQIMDLFQNE
jgi:glucose-1-phosphatase